MCGPLDQNGRNASASLLYENSTGNISCLEAPPIESWTTVGYVSMCATGMLIGLTRICLNGVVLRAIRGANDDNDTTAIFLFHNAIVDTVFGVLTLYQNIYLLFLYVSFTECVMRNSLLCGTTLLSMLIITGLNMERYIKISQPYRHVNIVTPYVIRVYLVIAWFLAGLFVGIPRLLWIGQPPYTDYCRFFGVLNPNYLMCVGIITFIILASQIFMYSHIFVIALRKLWRDRRTVAPHQLDGRTDGSLDWWKPARVVLLIVGVNVFTVTPVGIYVLLAARGHLDYLSNDDKDVYVAYVSLPCFFMSVLNPILYSFKIPKVKKAFVNILFFCKQGNSTDSYP